MKYNIDFNYSEIGFRITCERKKLRCVITEDPDLRPIITLVDPETPESKKVSQEILLKYMRQRNLPTFGRNTLSALENGDETAFLSINFNQWYALCDVFNCDLGYLFGTIPEKTYLHRHIRQKTGLSEKNIVRLEKWKKDNPAWITHINRIMQEPALIEILKEYDFLKATAKYSAEVYQIEKDLPEDEKAAVYFQIENAEKVSLYNVGRIAGNITKKITGQMIIDVSEPPK